MPHAKPSPLSDPFKAGQRVFTTRVHEVTGEEKHRYGTVERDEIAGWDYIDVKFDDAPGFVQPILAYYLFRDGEEQIFP